MLALSSLSYQFDIKKVMNLLLQLLILTFCIAFSQKALSAPNDAIKQALAQASAIQASDKKEQALAELQNEVLEAQNDLLSFHFFQQLAQVQRDQGKFEQASITIDKLFTLVPKTANHNFLGMAHYEKAQLLRIRGKYKEAIEPFELALLNFIENKNYIFESKTNRQLAYCYRSLGDYIRANRYIETSIKISDTHQLEDEKSLAMTAKSRLLSIMGLYQEALSYQLAKLNSKDYIESSQTRKASALYTIGDLYRRLTEYELAAEYFTKAYEIDLSINNQIDIGHSQLKLAQSYWPLEDYDKAMFFAKSALATFTKTKVNRHIAWAKSNIGDVFLAKQEYQEALQYLLASELTLKQLEEKNLLSSVRLSIANAYVGLGQYNEAEQWASLALTFGEQTDRLSTQVDANKILVNVYEQKKEFEKALRAQKALLTVNSKYIKQKHSYRAAYLKSSLDNAGKDIEIVELKSQKEQQAHALEQQRANYVQAIGVAIIALLLLILLLVFYFSRRKLYLLKQKLLADAIEKRNQLFTDISHELRTPLSVLKLQLQAMEYEIEEDIEKGYAKLHEKIGELDILINDIYQLSSIESQALSLSLQNTDINKWFKAQSKEWTRLVQSNGFKLVVINELPSVPCYLDLDSMRFKQVVLNIISNAIKYTDKPGEIKITLKNVANKVQLTISDSAPGVNDYSLPKLFDRFYRTDNSRSRDSGGSGLGLSIAKGIVQLHKGSIRAKHSSLGGLTISIRLPHSRATQ